MIEQDWDLPEGFTSETQRDGREFNARGELSIKPAVEASKYFA